MAPLPMTNGCYMLVSLRRAITVTAVIVTVALAVGPGSLILSLR